MKTKILFLLLGVLLLLANGVLAAETFADHCRSAFQKDGTCPGDVCALSSCPAGEKDQSCVPQCLPKKCTDIVADKCPTQYCAVMTDCSKQKICQFQMPGENAKCGNLAYAGQDVECCPGLVRRCGINFLDGSCDMEGKNSIYNLPICIPCGDGICGSFENHCNCPEDCPKKQGPSEEDVKRIKAVQEKNVVKPKP